MPSLSDVHAARAVSKTYAPLYDALDLVRTLTSRTRMPGVTLQRLAEDRALLKATAKDITPLIETLTLDADEAEQLDAMLRRAGDLIAAITATLIAEGQADIAEEIDALADIADPALRPAALAADPSPLGITPGSELIAASNAFLASVEALLGEQP